MDGRTAPKPFSPSSPHDTDEESRSEERATAMMMIRHFLRLYRMGSGGGAWRLDTRLRSRQVGRRSVGRPRSLTLLPSSFLRSFGRQNKFVLCLI